jgi:uncharacterized protein (TIRG00374 family)
MATALRTTETSGVAGRGQLQAHPTRRALFVVGRVLVSGVGLLLLFRSVDIGAAVGALTEASPLWLGLALLVAISWQVVAFIQWCLLLPRTRPRGGSRTRLFLRSSFLGMVVPAGVGGDAMRAREAGRTVGYGPAIAAIATSRFLTLISAAAWTLVGTLFLIDMLGDAGPVVATLVIVGLAATGAVAVHFDRIWSRRRSWRRLSHFRDEFLAALATYRRPSLIVAVLGVAGVSWGLNIASLALFSMAIGATVPWPLLAVGLAASSGITALPITVNGFGVREGALIAILVKGGVPLTTAAALTVFVDIQLIPLALAGAGSWLLGRHDRSVGHVHLRGARGRRQALSATDS